MGQLEQGNIVDMVEMFADTMWTGERDSARRRSAGHLFEASRNGLKRLMDEDIVKARGAIDTIADRTLALDNPPEWRDFLLSPVADLIEYDVQTDDTVNALLTTDRFVRMYVKLQEPGHTDAVLEIMDRLVHKDWLKEKRPDIHALLNAYYFQDEAGGWKRPDALEEWEERRGEE